MIARTEFLTKSSYLPPLAIITVILGDNETSEKVKPLYNLYLVANVGLVALLYPYL